MGKDSKAYFLRRAAEEMAAAERSTCTVAASVHREMSLRYQLRLILPEPAIMADDGPAIGMPKPAAQRPVALSPGSPSVLRSQG